MRRILLSSLLLLTFASLGCGQSQMIKDSWKFTTRQYRNYLNTPASVDLGDTGSCELYELALGEALIDVDAELQKLVRAMENSDHDPNQAWVMGMMSRIPWLSGVALVDKEGKIVAQYPEYFAKEFSVSPLLEPDPKQRMGALRAYVNMSQEPEVYLANPVYGGEDMRGLIVAHFDPRALVTMSADPGSFMLASPAGVLWPGRFGSGSVVAAQDWNEKLKKETCGVIGDRKSGFFWTTRWVGNLPLIYAMPANAEPSATPNADSPAQPLPSQQNASSGQEAANPAVVDVPGGQVPN